jgi:hypothetical protein
MKRPSAFLPMAFSAAAVALIVFQVARHGTAPQADEGAAAHLWQLLMAAELPLVGWFALRALPEAPRPALAVLALHGAGIVAALLPVFLLRW